MISFRNQRWKILRIILPNFNFTGSPLLIGVILFLGAFQIRAQSQFNPRSTQIGDMIWMTENLRIPHRDAQCFKGYDYQGRHWTYENMCQKFGRLYTIEAALEIADRIPGWHLPSDEEWSELERLLGMSESEVTKTKWRAPGMALKMQQGSMDSDLRILQHGGSINHHGKYSSVPEYTYYWSSSAASEDEYWCRGFLSTSTKVYRDYKYNNRHCRYYVRLVKDRETKPKNNSAKTSSSAPGSDKDVLTMKKLAYQYKARVVRELFPNRKTKTKYPQVYICGVQILINTMLCSAEQVTDNLLKIEYYQYAIDIANQTSRLLKIPTWRKSIEKGLKGMTAAEGGTNICEEYFRLRRPPNLKDYCRSTTH